MHFDFALALCRNAVEAAAASVARHVYQSQSIAGVFASALKCGEEALVVEFIFQFFGFFSEFFFVLLMAGTISGVAGMLVAIPAYTVIRVVAARFFPDTKLIRRLVGEPSSEQ